MTRRLRADFVETFLVEVAVLGAGLYLYRAASLQLGVAGVAEYGLARRVISLLQPLVVLGMDVGLVRYVAMSMGDRGQIARHVTTAGTAMAAATALAAALMLSFPGALAELFFGTRESVHLIVPLLWMLGGAALHPLAYSYLRGRSRGRPANTLQLLALAVAPLAAIALARGETVRALTGIGVGWIAVSLAALALARPPVVRPAPGVLSAPLVRYGLGRFPGDLIQVALFSVPPILVAHVMDQPTAAVFAFGISIVTMIGSMFVPVGHVLLPAASQMFKEGKVAELRGYAARLLGAAAAVATAGVLAAVVLAPWIVGSYLELDLPGAARELRLVVGAAIPFTVYMAARRIVDAVNDAPVNAINLAISFAVFGVIVGAGLGAGLGAAGVRVSFLVGCTVLAALTLLSVRRSLA